MQAEGSEVLAELEFLNQQYLFLSMENSAPKQRLESLAQEQTIKYCEFGFLFLIILADWICYSVFRFCCFKSLIGIFAA